MSARRSLRGGGAGEAANALGASSPASRRSPENSQLEAVHLIERPLFVDDLHLRHSASSVYRVMTPVTPVIHGASVLVDKLPTIAITRNFGIHGASRWRYRKYLVTMVTNVGDDQCLIA
jgi:hypothetical protein